MHMPADVVEELLVIHDERQREVRRLSKQQQ